MSQAANIKTNKELINLTVTKFLETSFELSNETTLFVLYQKVITRTKTSNKTADVLIENGLVAIKNQVNIVDNRSMPRFGIIEILCTIVCFFKAIMKRVIPKTRDRFATLDPIIFPMIIWPLLSRPAKKLVSISGAEVPNAITVEPMKKGDIPNFLAAAMEYFSSFSALIQINIMPVVIGTRVVRIIL